MPVTKAPRKSTALIAAEKRIAELEKELISTKSTSDMWYKAQQELTKEISGIHDILDGLDIPRKKPGESYAPDYTLSVRLFAWATKKKE